MFLNWHYSCFSATGSLDDVGNTILCFKSLSSKKNNPLIPRNSAPIIIVNTPTYMEFSPLVLASFMISLAKNALWLLLNARQIFSDYRFAKGISMTMTKTPKTIMLTPQTIATYRLTLIKSLIVYRAIS